MCRTLGFNSCWPYQKILFSAPTSACARAEGFTLTGSRNHPTTGWGKWTKVPCQALQVENKSEEWGNPDNNNESCHFNMEQEEVSKQGGIQSFCICLQNRYLPLLPHFCVQSRTAFLKVRYSSCYQREALPGLFSHFENSRVRMLWLYPSSPRPASNESLTSLKRYDRFSHFHAIVRKKLAFDLKLHSFGLSLMLLQDSLKWWNSKFGHNVTIQETMVTKHTDIHSNNVYVSWGVWHGDVQKGTITVLIER